MERVWWGRGEDAHVPGFWSVKGFNETVSTLILVCVCYGKLRDQLDDCSNVLVVMGVGAVHHLKKLLKRSRSRAYRTVGQAHSVKPHTLVVNHSLRLRCLLRPISNGEKGVQILPRRLTHEL